jgi:hypothetical protein
MKQSKNSFSLKFQIRWERIGKASWLDWRWIISIAVVFIRLVVSLWS